MPAAPLPVHIMLSKRKPTQPTMQHHSVYMNYNRYKKVILWMQTYAWNLQSKPRKLFWQNQDKRHLLKIPEGKGQIFSSLSPTSGTSQTHRDTFLSRCYFMKAWLLAVFSVTFLVAGSRQSNPTTVPACEGPLMCAVVVGVPTTRCHTLGGTTVF